VTVDQDMAFFNTPSGSNTASAICTMWYAVHTRHQHEKLVARALANKGFEVFLPLYSDVRQWRDRTKRVELPLFSCYVFLRGNLDRRLAIVTTPGIHGLVSSAGKLAPIPEAEIQAVHSVIENRIKVEPHPFLKCGDLVRVKSGALRGLEGFLMRKKGQTRLIISVSLLERSVAAEVDASAVERVPSHPKYNAEEFVSAAAGNWSSGETVLVPSHVASPI